MSAGNLIMAEEIEHSVPDLPETNFWGQSAICFNTHNSSVFWQICHLVRTQFRSAIADANAQMKLSRMNRTRGDA
jgi:hypothetical protein